MRTTWSSTTKKRVNAVIELLKANNLYSTADTYTLDVLGDNFELYEQAFKSIQEQGMTYTTPSGQIRQNPSFNHFNSCSSQIIHILNDFGISTKSRKQILRLDSEVEQENTPLNQFLNSLNDE